MKTEKTETGWKDITTTIYKVNYIVFNFLKREGWIDFNERHSWAKRKRSKCDCCKNHWEKLKCEYVHFVQTEKGNKTICKSCADFFAANGIKNWIKKREPTTQ